jgi:hypothetical protein
MDYNLNTDYCIFLLFGCVIVPTTSLYLIYKIKKTIRHEPEAIPFVV